MSKLSIKKINNAVLRDEMASIHKAETKYHDTVDDIVRTIHEDKVEIVFLAGPSGSGKTTTAHKITKGLKELGNKAYFVSLDDFYRLSDDYPLLADGTPDYETVHALDLPLFKEVFEEIYKTGSSFMPTFDFPTGERNSKGWKIEMNQGDIIVIEGLHALNPLITENILQENTYKLYISVSTRIYNENKKVVLSKRDLRFTRRLVRDYYFRASSVDNTFRLWQQVRIGEDKYLFPFRERADRKINSTHMYEPCLFKEIAISMLTQLDSDSMYYNDAQQLIHTFMRFETITKPSIPTESLLREFVGK